MGGGQDKPPGQLAPRPPEASCPGCKVNCYIGLDKFDLLLEVVLYLIRVA